MSFGATEFPSPGGTTGCSQRRESLEVESPRSSKPPEGATGAAPRLGVEPTSILGLNDHPFPVAPNGAFSCIELSFQGLAPLATAFRPLRGLPRLWRKIVHIVPNLVPFGPAPDAATGRSYRTPCCLSPQAGIAPAASCPGGLRGCAQWPRPEGPVADVPDAWGTLPMPPTGWPWPRLANHRPRCRRFEPVGTTPAASGLLDSAPSPRQRSAGGSFPLLLTRQASLRCRPPSAAGARGRAVG